MTKTKRSMEEKRDHQMARVSIQIMGCMVFCLGLCLATHAEIQKGKTNFWKNLEAGKHQQIDFVGGCITGGYSGSWVDTVANQLKRSFPNKVTYRNINSIQVASAFVVNPDMQAQLLIDKPNIVIYEVAEFDSDTLKFSCNLNRCVLQNWKQAIEWTRWKIPGCEIVFWIPWPTFNAPEFRGREAYANAARQLAADSSLYLVDTYWKMLNLYKSDPSPTCYALNNVNTGQTCPLYSKYLPDGVHVVMGNTPGGGKLVVDSVIAPAMIAVLNGSVTGDLTGASAAPGNIHSTLISDKEVDLAWDSVSQSADLETGICGYTIYRDGNRVSQQNRTQFKDMQLHELTTYTYNIAAYNGSLTEGPKSAPIQVTTRADVTPPSIVEIRANVADTTVTICNR
jgi:hypothetical protein